jgi:hypothetical protein
MARATATHNRQEERTNMKKSRENFLEGFLAESDLADRQEAAEQWDAWTSSLTNREIEKMENGGRRAGERYGREFKRAFAAEMTNAR